MTARVLVVEDTPANLKLASTLLRKAGYGVLQAHDGEQAIAMVRGERPDLVLMDIQLPGMDGLAATRILKADPATARIPVVALTAMAMNGDEQRLLAAGCDGYIAKPIQVREFLDEVQRRLAAAPAA
jgi:two-component system, cell cycle response regulator DivK